MTKPSLISGFSDATAKRIAKAAAVILTPVFLGACASMPDRMVDSCMKRGGGFNFLGLVAVQRGDEYIKACDEGRDLSLIATMPTSDGKPDPLAATVAGAAVLKKNPEIQSHYEAQLKERGLKPEDVKAAAEKLDREARKGGLSCTTDTAGKEHCRYVMRAPAAQ